MKITNEKLKKIIKEELENSIKEVQAGRLKGYIVDKIAEKIKGQDVFSLRQMIDDNDGYAEVYQAIINVLEK